MMKRPKPTTARPPMGPQSLRHCPSKESALSGQWRLYPIGDRATHIGKSNRLNRPSVAQKAECVTYVLNLKCYLCFDSARGFFNLQSEICNLQLNGSPKEKNAD